jgi:tetratricopeptide (TPR) repeat protein
LRNGINAKTVENERKCVPLDWVMVQNSLGNALSMLGLYESDTKRLHEAVEVYRAALEERTRERVPLQWAETQNNLGYVLRALGQRENSTAQLKEALAAWEACLTVTEPIWPANWIAAVRSKCNQVGTEIISRSITS